MVAADGSGVDRACCNLRVDLDGEEKLGEGCYSGMKVEKVPWRGRSSRSEKTDMQ